MYDCASTPGRVQRQHIPRISAESSAESCEFWHFHLHIYTYVWSFLDLTNPRVDFCQLQVFLQQNGQLVRVEHCWAVSNVWRVLKWKWTTSHQYEKRRFEPTKLKKNYTCFQKLILCVLHSQACTRMKSAKPNSVWFTLYTFRHNKCWQLTLDGWSSPEIHIWTKQPLHQKYTDKETRTIVYGNSSQQERWRFTAKPWHKFMASPAMLCSARGDAMALAVPLSARRQSSSAAAMWPRSRLCSCTMREKHEASTHFSSQTCLPSRSSKKDIAPNKKNDKTGNFQLTIIDHNATMIPPMASAPVHVSFFLWEETVTTVKPLKPLSWVKMARWWKEITVSGWLVPSCFSRPGPRLKC